MPKPGTFITADRCAIHGFASLHVMTLDENGAGGGTRLLGPKACCPKHGEVMRWRIAPAALATLLDDLAMYAPAPPISSGDHPLSPETPNG